MQKINIAIIWVLIGIFGRYIPHIPNATPLLSLCLLSSLVFSRKMALFSVLITLIVSDVLLSLVTPFSAFGTWTWFTYSGFVVLALLSFMVTLSTTFTRVIAITLISSLGYWAWTNLGVWCVSGMYPHTVSGLALCYAAALPFLRNALLGNMVWMAVFFGALKWLEQRSTNKLAVQ